MLKVLTNMKDKKKTPEEEIDFLERKYKNILEKSILVNKQISRANAGEISDSKLARLSKTSGQHQEELQQISVQLNELKTLLRDSK